MRKLLLYLLISFSFSFSAFSQEVDLGKMTEKERNEYLIKLAKEVTKNFGPGYYRENSQPVIVEEVYNTINNSALLRKHIGRKYYTVTFPYDKEKVLLEMDFTSQVKIWKDTGEVYAVLFGNGYGRHFFSLSYKEHLELGIEEDDSIKYQEVVIDTTSIWRKD